MADLEEMLTPVDVSRALKVSPNTLRDWRLKGKGPPWKKIGPLVRYPRAEFDNYVRTLPQGGAMK